jgi:hypothetical protein
LVRKLKIVGGAYCIQVPSSFFPDYSKHGVAKDKAKIEYKLTGQVKAGSKITYLSLPRDTEIS